MREGEGKRERERERKRERERQKDKHVTFKQWNVLLIVSIDMDKTVAIFFLMGFEIPAYQMIGSYLCIHKHTYKYFY